MNLPGHSPLCGDRAASRYNHAMRPRIAVEALPVFLMCVLVFVLTFASACTFYREHPARAFSEAPWGAGLGVTDASATRAGLEHVTGDNLYLKYAVEMGLFGILFLVLTFGGIIGHAFNLFRNGSTDTQRRMGAIIWLATIGLAINGMTAVVFNAITLGWLFFWLAGAVVTVSQRVTIPEAELAELELRVAE